MSCPFLNSRLGLRPGTSCCKGYNEEEKGTRPLFETPSKDWKEVIDPEEEQEFERVATKILQLQERTTASHGGVKGRPMHRRATHAFPATVKIMDEFDLPEFCRYGMFSEPGKEYEAILRLSPGASVYNHEDKQFAPKGLALKVKGLRDAPSCFEEGTNTTEQNFLMNALQPTFAATAEELANVAVFDHHAKGNDAKLAISIMKEYSYHGLSLLGEFVKVKMNDRNFTGFASSWFSTGLPHKCGPYAVKLRLQPSRQLPVLEKTANKFFWTDDIEKHLNNEGILEYDLQLQFFIDEDSTPIENGSVEWTSGFHTVAKVTIKKESLDIAKSADFKDEIENMSFSLWKGLEDHRPLGRVNRARKKVYYEAANVRGAA